MCGISGYVGFNSNEKVLKSLEIISHRGIDFRGLYNFKKGSLGHNRLSIQDTSELGNQPMITSDESVVLVYNGELWKGWDKKLDNLKDRGYFFKSNSDTEYILYLLHDCFKNNGNLLKLFGSLDGVFGIGVYDDRNSRIIVSRDWLGKIPVYYLHEGNNFSFGSELKQFTAFTNDLRNVKLLPPASVLTYDILNNEINIENFNIIPEYEECKDDKEVLVSNIKKFLTRGVDKRMIGDVGIATILSGGIDSLITTYLAQQINPDITAFVVSLEGYDNKKKDLYYARKAAEFMKIKLVEVVLEKKYIEDVDNIRETIYAVLVST